MNKATLVIMAAGIGSRFGGGIKQLEPVGPNGEIIMDYSIYDARQAGFDKVVFVIRKDLEEDFKNVIGNRIEREIEVEYAFQEVQNIPERYYNKFKGRTKPWGTGQAILCCKDLVKEPFLIINADDYYGREGYQEAFKYLMKVKKEQLSACMVGFVLENTLSDNGGVTRGLCKVNEDKMLLSITETSNIEKTKIGACVRTGEKCEEISPKISVSMNMWGITPEIFGILEDEFEIFLDNIPANNLKEEFLLPMIIDKLLKSGDINIKVLESKDKWFGVTYKEDKEFVLKSVKKLVEDGFYKEFE